MWDWYLGMWDAALHRSIGAVGFMLVGSVMVFALVLVTVVKLIEAIRSAMDQIQQEQRKD